MKAFENPSWIIEDLKILEITFSLLSKTRRLSDSVSSLCFSLSVAIKGLCVIRHLFLLTPQVLRDVTAFLCYRYSHGCFRRILVSVKTRLSDTARSLLGQTEPRVKTERVKTSFLKEDIFSREMRETEGREHEGAHTLFTIWTPYKLCYQAESPC